MRLLILGLLIVFSTGKSLGQCDMLSQQVLSLIKSQEYNRLQSSLMPNEQLLKILHWSNDSSSLAYLDSLNEVIENQFISSAESLRIELASEGLNLSNAQYVRCSRSVGLASTINIVFMIDKSMDSISIQTMETDQIYIYSSITHGTPLPPILGNQIKFIEGKKYFVFSPRKDEKLKAETFFRNEFSKKGIDDMVFVCVNGLVNEKGKPFLLFRLIDESNSQDTHLLFETKGLRYSEVQVK